MKFFESVFTAFLTREQRERISRNEWDKSVAAAALELSLEKQAQEASVPRYMASSPLPSSYAMTPSLSSSSSTSSSSSIRSRRPSSSCSTSPRPEIYRHSSIHRAPICYDDLIAAPTTPKPRRASNDAPAPQPLYPLPPLGPMQGIGKYRRSVDVTEEYLCSLERNTISALQPLIAADERAPRFKRDTTTPPRAYSVSPPVERQLAMQRDIEAWVADADMSATILEEELELENAVEEVAEVVVIAPVAPVQPRIPRVASKKRIAAKGPKTAKRAVKGKQLNKRVKKEMPMSASMETLVSGEE